MDCPVAFGAVAPIWKSDAPAFLVGGGASLSGFDFLRLAGCGVCIGVNQGMFDAPCSVGVSIDRLFVKGNYARLEGFVGELYLAPGDAWWKQIEPVAGAIYLRNEMFGLSRDPAILSTGGTSGYAALNLAVLKGAKRVVLLGYDYKLIDGRHHYHDAYPWHHLANDQSWSSWARIFDDAAPVLKELGVDVVNASPSSAINCFPKMTIEDALEWARSA